MTSEIKLHDAREIVRNVRRFCETEDTFKPSDDPHSMWNRGESTVTGIGLAPNILRKIYRDNYMHFISRPSKPLNIEKVIDYADELLAIFLSEPTANTRVANQVTGCVEILEKINR